MMSQLSCLSSQRSKDVVDSLRPSRWSHVVAAHEMKMVLQQSYFGGKPLPLPKPEEVAAMQQQGEYHDRNNTQSQLLYSSNHFEDDDDDQLMFARTKVQSILCYPPPPVSSPTSSPGKCSPPPAEFAAAGAVVCKPQTVEQQEHPSPAHSNGGVPTPPPPWSTSSGSSLSLNEDSSSSPPWSSPVQPLMATQLEVTTPALLLPVKSTLLPCSGIDHRSSCSQSLALDVADIRNDVKVLGLEEIERACSDVGNRDHEIVMTGKDVSCVITGWIQGEEHGEAAVKRKLVAVVWKHCQSRQGWKEWATTVKLISRVEDPHVCKLQGYCSFRDVDEQILVYEHICRGSLSDYLFGSLCKTLLDWRSRVRIALGAARALAYLHDLAPVEVVYKDFKSSNILLDLDFSVKLAGHGLDVIAGKAIAGQEFHNDENLFARWAKPYLTGDQELQLASILDPLLRRQLPCPGLRKVAALTLQCLQKDATKRPSISEVVDILDTAMVLQPACKSLHRRKTSSYKCMSLRRLQPSQTLKAGFSRSLSNKHL